MGIKTSASNWLSLRFWAGIPRTDSRPGRISHRYRDAGSLVSRAVSGFPRKQEEWYRGGIGLRLFL